MTDSIAPLLSRSAARIAGIGYAVIIACGLFAEFGVRQSLYVAGDPAKTFENIAMAETRFRTGIASDLLMLVADVAVAGALFVLFAPVSRGGSLLAAFFRLVQAVTIAASLTNLTSCLRILHGDLELARFQAHLDAHADGYRIGLVFFGVGCLILAWLAWRSRFVPKAIAGLLALAGAGYLADSFGQILWANYPASLTDVVLLPAFVGEIAFCGWLLVRGYGRDAHQPS